MKKMFLMVVYVFILSTVAAAETIKVGMPFAEAETLIKKVGGKEAQLSMMYFGPEENGWQLFYLPDDRFIDIVYEKKGEQKIIQLSSFLINSDVYKGDPRHQVDLQTDAQEIELNRMELTLEVDQETFKPGDVMTFTAEFRNVSGAPVLLNTYIIERKLRDNLKFYSRYEGMSFVIEDQTLYRLPRITPDDLMTLEPGGRHAVELEVKTVFPEHGPLWYENYGPEPNAWTGLNRDKVDLVRELPQGNYLVHIEYENEVCGFANKDMALLDCGAVKGDDRIFVGKLVSGLVEFALTQGTAVVDDPLSSEPGDDTACVFVTDCGWVDGLPKKLGGCGCFRKDYLKKILAGIEQGFYNNEAMIMCEAPPWPETACVCDEGSCKMDLLTQYGASDIPKSQALDIAKKRCVRKGYEWKDVSIEDDGAAWRVQTCGLQFGGDAEILVDKSTGKVLEEHFNPE